MAGGSGGAIRGWGRVAVAVTACLVAGGRPDQGRAVRVRVVVPGPHLKVDENTSPDQCLRIYWEDDPVDAGQVEEVVKVGHPSSMNPGCSQPPQN